MMKPSILSSFCLILCWAEVSVAQSSVKVLDKDNFDQETKEGFWLLEFYAPWCGHCKRLNPILDGISSEAAVKGMNIGKVDTTVEKKLADRFNIKGYPTLMFRVDSAGDWQTYDGVRKGPELLAFADRMLGDPLPTVTTQSDLAALEAHAGGIGGTGVAFIFGPGGGSQGWLAAAAKVARSVHDKASCGMVAPGVSLSWTGTEANPKPLPLNRPFLAHIESGENLRFYPGPLPLEDDEDFISRTDAMRAWILENNQPLVNELVASNFRKLGKKGKLLVVAVVNPANASTPAYLAGLRRVARVITAEDATSATGSIGDRFIYGHLDGIKWADFVKQFNIFNSASLPRLVVLDAPSEIFYEDSSVDEVDEIETFLHEVWEGKVPAQREGIKGSLTRLTQKVKSMGFTFWLGFAALVLCIFGACFIGPSDKSKYD